MVRILSSVDVLGAPKLRGSGFKTLTSVRVKHVITAGLSACLSGINRQADQVESEVSSLAAFEARSRVSALQHQRLQPFRDCVGLCGLNSDG